MRLSLSEATRIIDLTAHGTLELQGSFVPPPCPQNAPFQRLAMVFTGSIGLHNVLTSLRKSGYANDPTNDMSVREVPPLSQIDATTLALRLLEGEEIKTKDPQSVARLIASQVDGIAFYIHGVIDKLRDESSVTIKSVRNLVSLCLTDPMDPWHLRYFADRLRTYYTPEEHATALAILDLLASTSLPLSFYEIVNQLKSKMLAVDSNHIGDVITSLQRDHYVIQRKDGKYRFRFPMIQRWWKLARG